ncbi:MAG: nucleoid-associated protein [Syntrophomonadales bacterium]
MGDAYDEGVGLMRASLKRLQVDELIVHDIPKKLSRRVLREAPNTILEKPVFSQVASPINPEIVNFFYDKITDSIGSAAAMEIIFDTTSDSPVRQLISEYFFCDECRRLPITQEIAQHLFNIQNAVNPGGILLFIRCSLEQRIGLAILKVEREEGVRVRQQTLEGGLRTFDVEHIRDLMLTKKTKLFKIVLFYLEDGIIKGLLCDKQQSYGSKDVADFFLNKFLGCQLTEQSQVLTKRFFETTQKYINEKIDSPERKGELLNHLLSELTNQNIMTNPTEFARRVLPPNKQDDYIDYIQENGVTVNSFHKDCSIIENKLKKIQIDFASGISVFGLKEAINSKSSITEMDDGQTKMEIIDQLAQVRTK